MVYVGLLASAAVAGSTVVGAAGTAAAEGIGAAEGFFGLLGRRGGGLVAGALAAVSG